MVVQLQKSGTFLNRQIAYFGQCISTKNDFSVRNTVSLNAYWQTVYVYAMSIRYAIDFYSYQRKDIASFGELTNFFQKHRSPTAMCLIARVADNLINFKQLSRKGLVSLSYSNAAVEFSNSDHKQTS